MTARFGGSRACDRRRLERQGHAHALPDRRRVDRAAEVGDPLAHAGETRSLRPGYAASVVGHLENDVRHHPRDADPWHAGRRHGGRRSSPTLAARTQGQTRTRRHTGGRPRPWSRPRPRQAPAARHPVHRGAPWRGSRRPRPEPRRAPRGRCARRPVFVTGASRLTLRQTRGELGFHDDHRQRVAEEIVQVARDALPLGERGEPLDLLVGAAKATVRPLAFGIEEVRGAGHDREDEGRREAQEAPRQWDRRED